MEKKLNHYLYCLPDELSQMFLSSFHIVSWCKIKTFFYHLFLTLLNTEQYLSIDGHYSDTTVLFTKLYVNELTTYLFLYFKILSDHHNCEASKKKMPNKEEESEKTVTKHPLFLFTLWKKMFSILFTKTICGLFTLIYFMDPWNRLFC